MKYRESMIGRINSRIRIEKPTVRNFEQDSLMEEVRKYIALIPSEPNPNMGRVREIKEELSQGTYITREKIEEVAAHLLFG